MARIEGWRLRERLGLRRRPGSRGMAPLLAAGTKMSRRDYERWAGAHAWDPARGTGLAVESSLEPAAWLEPLLLPDSYEVRMSAPRGFEAYARVFYPFAGEALEPDGSVAEFEQVSWTELARRNGRVAHPLMEPETIGLGAAQCHSELSQDQQDVLIPMLARHTSSAEGLFLLWDGWGSLSERAFPPRFPKLHYPIRDYYLLRGPLDAYREFPFGPSYWWPDDRAWCWCSDTDFYWGYLAGPAQCIADVLGEPVLDAQPTVPDNPARVGMDVINDPGGTVPRYM